LIYGQGLSDDGAGRLGLDNALMPLSDSPFVDTLNGIISRRALLKVSVILLALLSQSVNKTLIGRRLRPRCRHPRSYFKRPKSSAVRPLAFAQFIANPKAACALRFSSAATSSSRGVRASMTSSIQPEIHNVSVRHQKRTEPRP